MADGQQAQGLSIWARPRRGARGPSPEYRLAHVAAAAIRVATSGGLPAVSMRAVASELGTTASTLYTYVVSRDELLDLMVDTAMADFAFAPRSEDWLAELVRLAEATRSLYLAQPWLLDARTAHSAPGPNTLSWFEHCLRAMQPLDRSTPAKMEAIGVLNGVIMLFARSASTPTAFDFSAIDAARHPLLTSALSSAATGGRGRPGDLFERTIRAVLVGLIGDGTS
jgi:AcrR family transcriptional regulator